MNVGPGGKCDLEDCVLDRLWEEVLKASGSLPVIQTCTSGSIQLIDDMNYQFIDRVKVTEERGKDGISKFPPQKKERRITLASTPNEVAFSFSQIAIISCSTSCTNTTLVSPLMRV